MTDLPRRRRRIFLLIVRRNVFRSKLHRCKHSRPSRRAVPCTRGIGNMRGDKARLVFRRKQPGNRASNSRYSRRISE